ncbi:hypothetical protein ABIE26_002996 [Pedobacter africanus]|uniref:hypothetical protein n=1 Tax=Pedobacter africanus TaxID=151894 RepID=UPI003391F13E
MGQFYLPVNLDKRQYLFAHEYGSGLQLMEHSWIGNSFVGTVAGNLIPGGLWYRSRIVWAGAYMDEGLFLDEFPEVDCKMTLFHFASRDKNTPFEKIRPVIPDGPCAQYLVNHTKGEFVDVATIVDTEDNWAIHPLPLLTCSGNGRGGGDFPNENPYLGTWAGNRISMQYDTPDGMREISPDFKE